MIFFCKAYIRYSYFCLQMSDLIIVINYFGTLCLIKLLVFVLANVQYSSPPLIRPPYLPRNCGHIRQVAFDEREN